MEKVILGLLNHRCLTIYEIQKALGQVIRFFYSASFGSIHPALQKLVKKGFATVESGEANGRLKKVYSITESGRLALIEWLAGEITISRVQDEGLLRLFFITELPKEKRLTILKEYSRVLQAQVEEIAAIEGQFKQIQIPEHLMEVYHYQMLTADFGKKYYQFELDWYLDVIQKIEKGEL